MVLESFQEMQLFIPERSIALVRNCHVQFSGWQDLARVISLASTREKDSTFYRLNDVDSHGFLKKIYQLAFIGLGGSNDGLEWTCWLIVEQTKGSTLVPSNHSWAWE